MLDAQELDEQEIIETAERWMYYQRVLTLWRMDATGGDDEVWADMVEDALFVTAKRPPA